MVPGLLRTVVWQIAGIVCYLVGVALFLVVTVDVITGPPEGSFANLSWVYIGLILVSLGLMVASGGILFAHREKPSMGIDSLRGVWSHQPETDLHSRDERFGEQFLPIESNAQEPDNPADTGVRCPSCDTQNDVGYRFCRACSSELPG